jgi:hypothetical protein
MVISAFRQSVRKWWEGEFLPHNNDARDSVIFTGGAQRRHWTSRACHAVVEYFRENHQWLIGTAIVAAGVLIAATGSASEAPVNA